MSTLTFLFAVLALLLAPGPTNTLIGLAGAQHGLHRVARLIPAELAGYLTAIVPVALLGGQVLASAPGLATGLKLAAALSNTPPLSTRADPVGSPTPSTARKKPALTWVAPV